MLKLKFLILLSLLTVTTVTAATTVSLTLFNPANAAQNKDTFVRFELRNYGAQVPRVIGTNIILPSFVDAYPTSLGVVTTTLISTADITPANTYYSVSFFRNGTKFYTCNVVISGTTQNLNNTSCLQAGSTPAPLPFTQCTQCPSGITTRACMIVAGANNGPILVAADIAPQQWQCKVPKAATVVEIDIHSDAGTSAVVVDSNYNGVQTALLSSALSSAGVEACANTTGGLGLDGVTTCSATLQNTTIAAGSYFEVLSATTTGAKIVSVSILFTVAN